MRRRARQDITSAVAYYRSVGKIVRIGSKKHTAQVVDITARRREVEALVKIIDAHGGRLGAFRGFQVRPPSTSPPPTTPRAEPA